MIIIEFLGGPKDGMQMEVYRRDPTYKVAELKPEYMGQPALITETDEHYPTVPQSQRYDIHMYYKTNILSEKGHPLYYHEGLMK